MHCFSIISSTFVAGFRIRVIPKDIVDRKMAFAISFNDLEM